MELPDRQVPREIQALQGQLEPMEWMAHRALQDPSERMEQQGQPARQAPMGMMELQAQQDLQE